MKQVKKGEIYWCDLSPVVGSEQGGFRPVLIIQNNMGNRFSPTTIVAIITSKSTKANIPTHYWLDTTCGLPCRSMVECEQLRTIDKSRLKERIGAINSADIQKIDNLIKISLNLV